MKDISAELHWIMLERHCSPMQAFCLLASEVTKDGICEFQPEPDKKVSGGLRDKSSITGNE